jgi:hypothetical protein
VGSQLPDASPSDPRKQIRIVQLPFDLDFQFFARAKYRQLRTNEVDFRIPFLLANCSTAKVTQNRATPAP